MSRSLTEFQSKILTYVDGKPDRKASVTEIAEKAFPHRWWNNPGCRGFLVGQVRMAAEKMVLSGHLECVFIPQRSLGRFRLNSPHMVCGKSPAEEGEQQ